MGAKRRINLEVYRVLRIYLEGKWELEIYVGARAELGSINLYDARNLSRSQYCAKDQLEGKCELGIYLGAEKVLRINLKGKWELEIYLAAKVELGIHP